LLSSRSLREYLHVFMKMATEESSFEMDFYYKKKIYHLSLIATGKKYRAPARIKKRKEYVPVRVFMDLCPYCNKLLVNGVCLYDCEASRAVFKDKNKLEPSNTNLVVE